MTGLDVDYIVNLLEEVQTGFVALYECKDCGLDYDEMYIMLEQVIDLIKDGKDELEVTG